MTAAGAKQHIFTIPPEVDFVSGLAEGLLADSAQRGIPLADYHIYLPTRRAARALRAAFAAQAGSLLLPRLLPLGEIDADALTFGAVEADLPPAIAPLRRRLLLMCLLRAREKDQAGDLSADGAWQLAGALAQLLDEMQISGQPPEALKGIVPAELAAHWQQVLDFLQLITVRWPGVLAALGQLDPVARHNLLVARQIEYWQTVPPAHPVIAAGSTASVPMTAALLRAIAALPQGMVILPGLDQTMPETIWKTLADEPSHPQHTMHHWLDLCGVPRRAVARWPYGSGGGAQRAQLLHTAFLPAAYTALWREADFTAQAWHGLSCCVAETQAEEAQLIALKLRAVLTQPERTAMLVTRDRQLAAGVVAALARWDVAIDDSAGQPLAAAPVGLFLQLVLAAALPDANPAALLALLKHPFAALGLAPSACRALARAAEVKFRRRRDQDPLLTLFAVMTATPPDDPVHALFLQLQTSLAPLTALLARADVELTDLLATHLQAAEHIAAGESESGASQLWRGAAGEAAATLFHELQSAATDHALPDGRDYPALLRAWLAEAPLRPAYGLHPRLSILGPLEARLQQADCVILGGLHEASWPGDAAPDPWLSRPMRSASGLPPPERQIGLAAHDFVQLASRGEVLLTRARKLAGQPVAPSRFLLRLETLRAALGHASALPAPDEPWLRWAQTLDAPAAVQPMPRPAPRPSAALRPRRFAVTEIGPWRANPYGFYAKHMLALRPLAPLVPESGAADFGTLLHKIVERCLTEYRAAWPGTAAAATYLMKLTQELLAPYRAVPLLHAAWQAQAQTALRWFAAAETLRREAAQPLAAEAKGLLQLSVNGINYQLDGRADRVDALPEGYAVIDYKTGTVPSDKQIAAGIAPQLPLLGLMLSAGAFPGLPPRPVAELLYYKLAGRDGAQEIRLVRDSAAQIPAAYAMLEDMLRRYADANMPYLVEPQPEFSPRFDDYRHLGRIAEWGLAGGEETE